MIMRTSMINKILSVLAVFFFCLTSALAANIQKDAVIYFDVSDYPEIQQSIASGKKLQVLVGHDGWSEGFLLTKVSGSVYKTAKLPNWGNCTKLGFMTVDSKWPSEGKGVEGQLQHGYAETGVYNISSDISKGVSVTFLGNPLLRVDKYPASITYTLMGVNNDWTKGIAFEPNPDNEGEYMLLNQKISNSKDAVKVVAVEGSGKSWAY